MLTRRSTLTIIDQIIVSGSNFALIFICAQYLTPQEQGRLGYVVAGYFATVMICVSSLFQQAAVESAKQTDVKRYLASLRLYQAHLGIVVTVFISIVVLLLSYSSGWHMTLLEFTVLFAFLFMQQISDFDRRSNYLVSNIKRALLSSAITHGVRVGLLLLVMLDSILSVLLILLLSSAIFGTVFIFELIRSSVKNSYGESYNKLLDSKWLTMSGILSWANGHIPLFISGIMISIESVGILVTLRSITNIANVGIEMLETRGAVILSALGVANRENQIAKSKSIFLIGLFLWMIGIVLFLLAGKEITSLLFGEQYASYWYFIPMFWAVNLFIFVFKLISIDLRVLGRTKAIFMSHLVGMVTIIPVTVLAIVIAGFQASLVGYMLSILVLCIVANSATKKNNLISGGIQ